MCARSHKRRSERDFHWADISDNGVMIERQWARKIDRACRASARVVTFTNRAQERPSAEISLAYPSRSTPQCRSSPPGTNTPIVSFNKLVPQCHSIFRCTMRRMRGPLVYANNRFTIPMHAATNCSLLRRA